MDEPNQNVDPTICDLFPDHGQDQQRSIQKALEAYARLLLRIFEYMEDQHIDSEI